MTDTITLPRATVQQALDALERALETSMRQALKARIPECGEFAGIAQDVDWATTALRAALGQQAEPVQEPVAIVTVMTQGVRRNHSFQALQKLPDGVNNLYTSPQQQAEPVDQQLAKLAQHCTMLEQKLALTEQQAPKRQAELRLSSEEIQQVLAAASVPEGLRTPEMGDCLQKCRDRATGTIKIQEWEDAKTASMVPVIPAESITDAMMNLVDRLGSEWKQVDLRAWQHLFVYAPQRKPLTDEEIDYWIGSNSTKKALARAIEAAHGIK